MSFDPVFVVLTHIARIIFSRNKFVYNKISQTNLVFYLFAKNTNYKFAFKKYLNNLI